jgi:hypothetical protein
MTFVYWLRTKWNTHFATKRFAKILKEFLVEVAVLVFVFPTLDGIIKGDTGRIPTLLIWSLVVSAVCLATAAIIATAIGDV